MRRLAFEYARRCLWAASLLSTLAVTAVAPGATTGPTEQLKTAIDQVLKILDDPALKPEARLPERRKAIRRIADEIFDFEEMAQRALGQHWRPLTAEQRKEFIPLFADLLDRAYISTIERYSGEPIQYTAERVEGDLAMVSTKIIAQQATEIPVVYRMLRHGDRWLVYDVSVEGVSLVANYRTQFNNVIRRSSFDELMKRMRTRIEEFRAPQR
ncbi:MAG TPA: ABC transporter substrate-binding protein [Terriglobales bacterium]|nr:ABC transporter substrate-binding protein [Terriglobales bacterium]